MRKKRTKRPFWTFTLCTGFLALIMMTLSPSSSANGLTITLNGEEFTNQETLMWTVTGEPYQNCTVLFGNNKWNAPYQYQRITLNDTGVYIGYLELTEYRDYDVKHWISVQNRSSSAMITYILRYSDAQRFEHDQAMMSAIWGAIGLVLGVIVVIVLVIAFREREKRLDAQGKLTVGEKFSLQVHNRFQMNRVMSVWDKIAPSSPKEQHRYKYKLIKWTQLALVQAILDKDAFIEELIRKSDAIPGARKTIIDYLRKEGLWPIQKMTVDQEEAVLRPGEPVDLRKLLRRESRLQT